MADIFLSYKKEDRELAESIIGHLETEGFSVWYDERLHPLQSWDATIEAEIKQAKAVVVLWTSRSVSSEWVRNEADYGKENAKLIPLLLEDCEIPLAFRRVQAANLIGWDGDSSAREWRKACRWISTQTGGGKPEAGSSSESALTSQPAKMGKTPQNIALWIGAVSVIVLAGIALFTSGAFKGTSEERVALDPRQEKARELYQEAYFLTPRNIGARMHLESDRSRLCISSNFESNQWENLFRAVNANDRFKSWSLGFDLTIATENLMSGDCLVLAVSSENLASVKQLGQLLEVEHGKQYRLVPMTEMYEAWELGL